MNIMLHILTFFQLLLILVHGHVENFPAKLEFLSEHQHNSPILGNYTVKHDQDIRGIPTYQNVETEEEILFDGKRFWTGINNDYQVIPIYPKDTGGMDINNRNALSMILI